MKVSTDSDVIHSSLEMLPNNHGHLGMINHLNAVKIKSIESTLSSCETSLPYSIADSETFCEEKSTYLFT